jgi:FkbM family methyltransferase
MEGNFCYKFSTIRNYIEKTGAPPVRLCIDVGVNVGDITRMMREYFPDAWIFGYEPVPEYFEAARQNLKDLDRVRLFRLAVTAQHRFRDDLGRRRRKSPAPLSILKATPEGGPGWAGGSRIVGEETEPSRGYEAHAAEVEPITLDELIDGVLKKRKAREIDILKMDCEGCEHSSLGAATSATLRKIRYIVGEYHGIARFHSVMAGKLFKTHKVNLIGDKDLGAFFAERLDGTSDGVLRFNKEGMLQPRPWLAEEPIDWHLFSEEYVLPEDRYWHALP